MTIAVFDTNVYFRDVRATKQHLSALFDALDRGDTDDLEVWTPRVVVEELVRQYAERLERVAKVLGSVKADLAAFDLQTPSLPLADSESYRKDLTQRLTGTGRRVAEHPADIGRAIDWAAGHLQPVRAHHPPPPAKGEPDLRHFQKRVTVPISGVADAAIWLTIAEAASKDTAVVVVTTNAGDFSHPEDRSRVSDALGKLIAERGVDPGNVQIVATIEAFNAEYVSAAPEQQAQAFLSDDAHVEALLAEISDAVEWVPLDPSGLWAFDVEIDDLTLAHFEAEDLTLTRADRASKGIYMTIEARGTARLDIGIRKADAYGMEKEDPVHVVDWDWNEAMVLAEAEVPASVTTSVLLSDGEVAVSVEDIAPAEVGGAPGVP